MIICYEWASIDPIMVKLFAKIIFHEWASIDQIMVKLFSMNEQKSKYMWSSFLFQVFATTSANFSLNWGKNDFKVPLWVSMNMQVLQKF